MKTKSTKDGYFFNLGTVMWKFNAKSQIVTVRRTSDESKIGDCHVNHFLSDKRVFEATTAREDEMLKLTINNSLKDDGYTEIEGVEKYNCNKLRGWK